MFFESIDGKKYPTAMIAEIGEEREVTFTSSHGDRKGAIFSIQLTNGDTVEVRAHRVEELLRQPVSAFPAHPGTYTLSRAEGETFKWPVIGWSISQDGGIYPVTMNGVNHDGPGLSDVLLPTGDVTGFDVLFKDLAEWEQDYDEKASGGA
jgi:hypothetical protein